LKPIAPERWQVLSPLLDELLVLPPLDRDQRLATLTLTDPTSAAELQHMLAEREQASRVAFLGGVADPSWLPNQAQAGDTLGAWTLTQPLGEGGMGTVWLAQRSDGRFEGQAAIKLLRTGLFDPLAQERFRREGAILAKLHHPGIAQLLDAGVTTRGQPYLVLERVQGQRIDAWCSSQKLGVPERLRLALQASAAVAAAHAQLVIHRDLKPSNIWVNEQGQVKLLDFGIATLQSEEAGPGLTREGAFALTPAYAAPEQFNGGTLSMATDVYALGVVLFELLTGQHPSGLTTSAASAAMPPVQLNPLAYMQAALRGPAGLTSTQTTADYKRYVPALRGDIDNILAKALQPEADQRYASVAALQDDLQRHLAHLPIAAHAPSLIYRAQKLLRRNPWGVAASAALATTVLAGVLATTQQARRADTAAAAAMAQRDVALRELDYAQTATEFVTFVLAEGAESADSGQPFTPASLMARAEALVQQGSEQRDPESQARLLLLLATQRTELTQTAEALPLLQRAQATARAANNPALQVAVSCLLGHTHTLQGQNQAALQVLDQALSALQNLPDIDGALRADCLVHRSTVQRAMGNGAAALADAQTALALFGAGSSRGTGVKADTSENLPSQTPKGTGRLIQIAGANEAQAGALRVLGRHGEAVNAYRAVLADLSQLGRGGSARAATTWNNLGNALGTSGQSLLALQAYERSRELTQQITGTNNDVTLTTNVGKSLVDVGRLAQGMALLQQAQADARASNNPRIVGSVALIQAAAACGSRTRATASLLTGSLAPHELLALCSTQLQLARKWLEPTLPKGHSVRALMDMVGAQVALAQNQTTQAQDLLQQALASYDKPGGDATGRVRVRVLLTKAALATGDNAQALQHASEALAQAKSLMQGFTSTEALGVAFFALAQTQAATGDRAASRASAEQAVMHLRAAVGDQALELTQATQLLNVP
jgi:eukaryotic-like serine/threonine-protein kinase